MTISEEDCVAEDFRLEHILIINIFLDEMYNLVDVSQPSTARGAGSIESK